MAKAQSYVEQGEFYKAEQVARRLQSHFPDDPEVRDLATRIRARQDERHEALRFGFSAEETSARARKDFIQTLNERAESYFEEGRYQDAADTAQEIFQYEAGNARASELLDRIGRAERKEAGREENVLTEIYREEMSGRIESYRHDTRRAMDQKRWGRARFTLEKWLLLDPKDSEANRLYEQVLAQQEKKAA